MEKRIPVGIEGNRRKEERLVFGKRDMEQYGVENVRTNEKFYILDSDLSLQDVTSRHSESTQISGIRLPWERPKLWLQSDLDSWLWVNSGMGSGGQRSHQEFPMT